MPGKMFGRGQDTIILQALHVLNTQLSHPMRDLLQKNGR